MFAVKVLLEMALNELPHLFERGDEFTVFLQVLGCDLQGTNLI